MRLPSPRQAAQVLLVVNGVQAVVWLVMLPMSLLTGLKGSLPYLVFLSVWALEGAALAGVVAGMAALRAEQDRER